MGCNHGGGAPAGCISVTIRTGTVPVRRDIAIRLDMEHILRRQEIGPRARLRPELLAILQELLTSVHDLDLLKPAFVYEFRPVDEVRHAFSLFRESGVRAGFTIPPVLSEAVELAFVVCTIGPRLDERVAYYSKNGEPLRALMLDGIGSAAVDLLAQEACNLIGREAQSKGCQASSPLSPGMPELPIAIQRLLFRLVPADQIGVSLTGNCMMVPLKSVSMVIGLGPTMPAWTQAEVCARCGLNRNCLHRVLHR
jgi:hypothetical protein